jgi:hypothetical protein
VDKIINVAKFFQDHGEETLDGFQNHIGINEDYVSVNFSFNGSWFNIGQYNDNGYSRTIIQEIVGPDVELLNVKELTIHGEIVRVNNQISRNINKKINILMKSV